MNNDTIVKEKKGKKNSKTLLIITTVFAVLYLIGVISFYVDGFIDGFKDFSIEIFIANLSFIVFLVGYYFCWKNELLAGSIFIFWWGIMWILGLFIAEQDRGVGVVIGIPIFILGVLFIVKWYRKRSDRASLA